MHLNLDYVTETEPKPGFHTTDYYEKVAENKRKLQEALAARNKPQPAPQSQSQGPVPFEEMAWEEVDFSQVCWEELAPEEGF